MSGTADVTEDLDGRYLTSQTSHADVVVDGDFTSNGLMKRTGAGTYSIVTDNSSSWNAADPNRTMDATPTDGNTANSVSSDGVFDALAGKSDTHSHPYDNYSSWTIMEGNGTESTTIGSGQTLHLEQGTGITVEYTATRQLTITNTAPNTNLTHSGQVSGSTTLSLTNSAVTGQTALTSGLAGTDELIVSDGGTIKRMDISVMNAYFNSNLSFGSSNLALGSSSSTAYRGDRGTTAYNHSQAAHAPSGAEANRPISDSTSTTSSTTSASSTAAKAAYDRSWPNTNQLTTWNLDSDANSPTTIGHGEEVTIAGGTNCTTSRSGNTLTVNSSHATHTGHVTGSTALTIASKHVPTTAYELPTAIDLDDYAAYADVGFYYQTSNADAVAGDNYPADIAGSLLVQKSAGSGDHASTQLYIGYDDNGMWYRGNYTTAGTWQKVSVEGHTHHTYDHSTHLSGANVFDQINVTNGIVTSVATRALTAGNIGAATSGHDHSGTYEPADADITKRNEIETITGAWIFQGGKNFYSTDTSGSYTTCAVEIKEVNQVNTAQTGNDYAPALSMHWGGRTQGKLWMQSLNSKTTLSWTVGTGSGSYSPNGHAIRTGSFRAEDDTGNDARIIFESTTAPRNNWIGMNSHDNIVIAADDDNLGTDSNIQLKVDNIERMRISNTQTNMYQNMVLSDTSSTYSHELYFQNNTKIMGMDFRDTGRLRFIDRDNHVSRIEFDLDDGSMHPDGNIILPATQRIYFDGWNHTYIAETSADELGFVVGGSTMLELDQDVGRIQIKNGHNLLLESPNSGLYRYKDSTAGQVPLPGGAFFNNQSNAQNGAIKIALPTATFGQSEMGSFWVDVFNYETNSSYSIYISSYFYQGAGLNTWHLNTCIINAHSTFPYTIYLGDDGTRACMWIGDTTDTGNLDYIKVQVRDVQMGHSSTIGNWADGWEISISTTARTNTDTTLTGSTYQGHSSTAASATWADQCDVNSSDSGAGNYSIVWHSGDTLYRSSHMHYNRDNQRLTVPNISLGTVKLSESTHRAELLRVASATTTWSGVQIGNDTEDLWNFMADGNVAGIYNDSANHWHIHLTDTQGVALYYNNSSKFTTTNTGVAITGTQTLSSDIKLKDVLGEYEDVTAKDIPAQVYNWKDGTGDNQVGYIAQEVEKVLPKAVHEDEEGMKSVDYSMVHTAKIAELETEVKELRDLVKQLLEAK